MRGSEPSKVEESTQEFQNPLGRDTFGMSDEQPAPDEYVPDYRERKSARKLDKNIFKQRKTEPIIEHSDEESPSKIKKEQSEMFGVQHQPHEVNEEDFEPVKPDVTKNIEKAKGHNRLQSIAETVAEDYRTIEQQQQL